MDTCICIDSLLLNLRRRSGDWPSLLSLRRGWMKFALVLLGIVLLYYVRELFIRVRCCLLLLLCSWYYCLMAWRPLLALWVRLVRILIFHILLARHFLSTLICWGSLFYTPTRSLIRWLDLALIRSLHVVNLKAVVIFLLRALHRLTQVNELINCDNIHLVRSLYDILLHGGLLLIILLLIWGTLWLMRQLLLNTVLLLIYLRPLWSLLCVNLICNVGWNWLWL